MTHSRHSPTDAEVRLHHQIRGLTRGMDSRLAFLIEHIRFCAIYRDDLNSILGQLVGKSVGKIPSLSLPNAVENNWVLGVNSPVQVFDHTKEDHIVEKRAGSF